MDTREEQAKTDSSSRSSSCDRKSGLQTDESQDREVLSQRLGRISHKVLVLSGKGGVGKSTVAVRLATSLAEAGKTVGLLDVDIHGPSIPALLGLGRKTVATRGEYILPVPCRRLKVMSIGFLLPEDTSPVIWRGPMKMNVIKQFLKDVDWGPLDYLIVDCPPGTGDEPLSVAQLIDDASGAIIVTTPQELSLLDVRKSITFCKHLELPVLGVVENMSGFVCPHCGHTSDIFRQGGGEQMAGEMGVPFLARIPIDPALVLAGDEGKAFPLHLPESAAARAFNEIAQAVLARPGDQDPDRDAAVPTSAVPDKQSVKRIAIPLAGGQLAAHFGHCEEFALVDVDAQTKSIAGQTRVAAPDHQPGLLPPWLRERRADLVIAGGMGQRAQQLFEQHGIAVVVGAPSDTPESVVQAYLDGSLLTSENLCDH